MCRHRYGLLRICRGIVFCCALMLLCFFLIIQESGKFSILDIALRWSERDPRSIIRSAAPVFAWAGNQEGHPGEITPGSLVAAIPAPFRINPASPGELLASQIPVLSRFIKKNKDDYRMVPALGIVARTAVENGAGSGPESLAPPPRLTSTALLGIYYTHTGETYALTDGTERLTGKKGGVVMAGRAIKETLENEYGIRVACDERVNDEKYALSYVESEKTARRLLEENRDMQILLDIHRDAGKSRNQSLVRVNGRDVAPILFIVGSDARSPFPNWRKNYDYALKLEGKINKKYPGLCIGVRIKEGRYNQFLHPRALLVEMGSVSNSTEEAVESAIMLARVLAGELMERAPRRLFDESGEDIQPAPAGI